MNPPRRRRPINPDAPPTEVPQPAAPVPTPPPAPAPQADRSPRARSQELIEAQVKPTPNMLQDIVEGPPDLNLAVFAETGSQKFGAEVIDIIEGTDLIISLGHVNLLSLAQFIPERKPALCVYGPQDRPGKPPKPFRWLHGNGVTFKEWRIAGFSGALRVSPTPGFYISPDEAQAIVTRMPASDILLSYAPPTGIENPPPLVQPFEALEQYVQRQMPLYQLYARSDESTVDEMDGSDTLIAGIHDFLVPPPLVYA